MRQVLSKEEQELAAKNEYNFDHPDAFDFELLVNVLRKLKKGKSIKVPVYDFTSHCRRKEWVSSPPGGHHARRPRRTFGSARPFQSFIQVIGEGFCREKSGFKDLLPD